MKIGEQICALRKQRGLTQEELAGLLGVTNQAVSKWESGKCYPDLELLPEIASIFKCTIDHLFSVEDAFVDMGNTYELCTEFPWHDDEIIRGVVCKGRKILSIQDGILNTFTFTFKGEAKSVKSHCNLTITGNVSGGCNAGGHVTIHGEMSGGCNAGGNITSTGGISGGVNCGESVMADFIRGDVSCQVVSCPNIDGEIDIQEA